MDSKQLYFRIAPELPLPPTGIDHLEGGMGVTLDAVNEQLICRLHIPARLTLMKETSLMFALDLTHETVHINKAFTRFEEAKQSTTLDAFVLYENKNKNLNRIIPEEAEAYALQANALIYQFGLGSFLVYQRGLHDAASFIRYGKDSNDLRWHEHLKSHNLVYLR